MSYDLLEVAGRQSSLTRFMTFCGRLGKDVGYRKYISHGCCTNWCSAAGKVRTGGQIYEESGMSCDKQNERTR